MTYHSYHKEKLNMMASIYYSCFMYTPKCLSRSSQFSNASRVMVCLQTNDTAYTCHRAFSDLVERMSAEFGTKPAKFLEEGNDLKFNGAIISHKNRTCSITQPIHVKNLSELDFNTATKAGYVVERACGVCIVAICCPDATYALNIASQITNLQKKDFKNLNKMIASLLNSLDKDIGFVPLQIDSLVITVFFHAGFATNSDSSSQL